MYLRGLKGRAASSVAVGAAVAQGRLKSCRIAWFVSCCIDSTCGRAGLLSSCGRATFTLAIASDLNTDIHSELTMYGLHYQRCSAGCH